MNPIKTTYSIYFVSIFFLSLFSCNDNSNATDEVIDTSVVDSVSNWIAQGKNRNFARDFRLKQLSKAKNASETINNDSLKTAFFSGLSLAYLEISDSLKFRQTNFKAMKLATITRDSTRMAEAHWDLADFFRSQSIADSSYYHFSEAQKIYTGLKQNSESGRMLYNMALVQADIKDYTGSEINAIKAIEILKPLDSNKSLYRCYSILATVTKELKEFERAIEYYNTALAFQKKIPGENTFDLSLKNNLGALYQEQGNHIEAIRYFEQVLSHKNLLEKYPILYAKALNNLAYSNMKINKKIKLPAQFERAISIQDSIRDIRSISRSHYSLAEYYLNENDTLQALIQAKKAKNYAEKSNNNDRLLQTLQLLVKLEPSKSIAYNQKYIALSDSLQQEERQMRNKFARIRFETDEFIAENEMLAKEKQLWTGIAGAVLLLGLMSFIIIDQRAKNQKLRFQQEQQAANQEIFNLMLGQKQKVEEGKKLEQKRISEELHDGVLGKMLGARMVLTGLNKKAGEEAAVQRKKAIDALQDVEKEVRAISHELSHAAYQKMHNFIHSLKDLLKTVQATGSFSYTFDHDEEFEWDDLNGDSKINVYRMIQESLQNCVKHAQCENIAVKLTKEINMLKITIADDGKGFKTNTGKKGIGMRNISSRIKKLKGSWDIESTPGKGTTITLMLPLAYDENANNKSIEEKQLVEEV